MPSQTLTRIDWRKLSAIDVNTFESELHSNRWPISEIGPMIAYSFIDSEFDLHSVDTNFVKLFKLSQILIAYLLEIYYNQYENLKDKVDKVKDIVEENRKLRKLLGVYKQAFTFGATFSRSINSETDNSDSSLLFQCPDCPKAFGNSMYLQSHIYRRHPENSILSKGLFPLTQRINQYQSALIPSNGAVDDVKKELTILKDELKKTEKQLTEEKQSRLALQERMDSELEVKVKQLTSLLKMNQNDETVEQLVNRNKKNQNDQMIRDLNVQRVTEIDVHDQSNYEDDDEQLQSEGMASNLDEPKDLTELLMVHTQEVRNLGVRLEKLVDKLWSNDSVNSQENLTQKVDDNSTSDLVKLRDKKTKSGSLIGSSPMPKETASDKSDQSDDFDNDEEMDYQKNQGNQVLSYLDRYMEALGIQDKINIGSSEFVEAMKVIKERRRRNGFQEKVNSLKDAIDYEIRTRGIGQTLAQLNADSKRPTSKSLWLIAKNSLEETSSKHQQKQQEKQEKQTRVHFGGITIRELDESRKTQINKDKAIKRQFHEPKSVLIRRDAEGNRIGNHSNWKEPQRRISFSDTRIEISPEYSSDDDDFDQMMSSEIQTAPMEPDKDLKVEQLNSSLETIEDEKDSHSSISSNKSQEKVEINLQQYDPIPPLPKPRHSKALTLDDHLSTADLKWFDSDESEDEINYDNQKAQSTSKSDKNVNINHRDNLETGRFNSTTILNNVDNQPDDQRISVTELTKIIEEQLHNRQTKPNLINSVDTVTGKVKSSNSKNSYDVKAIGTLNYDSDSD